MNNDTKEISSAKIILMGELMVNLPVTIIILITSIMVEQLGINWNLAIITGVAVGWYCWSKLLDKWKTWAFKNNVEPERLFRLGKLGLINFYRYKIIDSDKKT